MMLPFEAFDQVFNSDEWDDWFDNEIKVLSKKLESVKKPNILSNSNIDTSNDECTTAAQDNKHMTTSEVASDEDINYSKLDVETSLGAVGGDLSRSCHGVVEEMHVRL